MPITICDFLMQLDEPTILTGVIVKGHQLNRPGWFANLLKENENAESYISKVGFYPYKFADMSDKIYIF